MDSLLVVSAGTDLLPETDVLNSLEFSDIQSELHEIWSSLFDVYTDGLLKDAGTADVVGGTAAYFFSVNLNVGVRVCGLLSSTLSELQVVALALECVPSSCAVVLYLDSQAAIDVCVSEMSLAVSDFRGHSGVIDNIKADAATGYATCSKFFLSVGVCEHFLVAENTAVSGNVHYFIRNVFQSICCAHWEAGPGQDVVPSNLVGCVDWDVTAKIWHPDSHMLVSFTSQKFSGLCIYLIKAVHRWLPVAVRKRLYNKRYSGVLCLSCGEVKMSNHVFTCVSDAGVREEVLAKAFISWTSLLGVVSLASSAVLQDLSWCSLDVGLYSVLCKRFVLRN
ncbi:hypothetical protein G9A89_023680 [Geosiphon pyriformis]|nr:hypothetical protein G9A89_023680 [Geosiphon pyriformis]